MFLAATCQCLEPNFLLFLLAADAAAFIQTNGQTKIEVPGVAAFWVGATPEIMNFLVEQFSPSENKFTYSPYSSGRM